MNTNNIYALEDLNSITDNKFGNVFLAGPTPRNKDIVSWRNNIISIFNNLQFKGNLLIPEFRDNTTLMEFEFDEQIEWENKALDLADIIIFWIPRELDNMPGYTTNIEFGFWLAKNPNKLCIGAPDNAPKMKYIKYQAIKNNIPYTNDIEKLVSLTLIKLRNTINNTF